MSKRGSPYKVSVITPCCNQASFLTDCLDSLIAQTYPNWECVVIDDGSSDNSYEIAQHYAAKEPRIRCFRQVNLGPSAARNNAIALTNGEYIFPLDSDDYIDPTYFEKALAIFREFAEIKLVYSRCLMFGSQTGEMELKPYSYQELLRGNIITNTSVYKRSDFLKTPGYDETMRIGWEDWDFYLSLITPQSQVMKIDETLFYYRQKASSRNNSVSAEQASALRRYIYLKHSEIYRDHFEDPINLAYQVKTLQRQVRHLQNRDIVTRLKRRISSILSK